MKAGFTGKIIEVNLSLGRIEKINIDSRIVQQYLGGAGLGVKILYDQAGPEIDAFSEDNIIVIAPGPLSGTAAPTNSLTTSTVTLPYVIHGSTIPSSKPPLSSIFLTSSCAWLRLNPMNVMKKAAVNQTIRAFMIFIPFVWLDTP